VFMSSVCRRVVVFFVIFFILGSMRMSMRVNWLCGSLFCLVL